MSRQTPELITEIVQAGAGAGKTTGLIKKVFDVVQMFLQQNSNQLPKMCVTTFTRKATQELRERLMIEALKRNDPKFLEFVLSHSKLHISTIHGVLSLFLRRYSFYLGVDPSYSSISTKDEFRIAARICRLVFSNNIECLSLLEEFTISEICDLVLEIHNARSSTVELKPFGISDWQLLIKQKLKQLNKTITDHLQALESYQLNKQWQAHKQWAEQSNSILSNAIEDMGSAISQLENLLDGHRIPTERSASPTVHPEVSDQAKEVKESIKRLIAQPAFSNEFMKKHDAILKLIEVFYQHFQHRYEDFRKESSFMTIDDLEKLSLELITQKPPIAKEFSDEWDFWLIDEFQDTSPKQVEILTSLIGDKPHYIVGDPQQSIYLFRGADVRVFNRQKEVITSKNGKFTSQEINYRSVPSVLSFINDSFAPLNFIKMKPSQNTSSEAPPLKECVIEIHLCDDEDFEINQNIAILERIHQLRKQGAHWRDIGILTRNNQDLNDLSLFFTKHQVPFLAYSSSGLYEKIEITDALMLLKFLFNPHDNINTASLMRTPWYWVGDNILQMAAAYAAENHQSLWSSIENLFLAKSEKKIENLLLLKSALEMSHDIGISDAFEYLLFTGKQIQFAIRNDPTGKTEANLHKLVLTFKEAAKLPGFNCLNWIKNNADITLENSESEAAPIFENDCINILTIHKSKGLQFAHVILPNWCKKPVLSKTIGFTHQDGLWTIPIRFGSDDKKCNSLLALEALARKQQAELLEFERVQYVAITRAKQSITKVLKTTQKDSSTNLIDKGDYSIVQRFNPKVEPSSLPTAATSNTPTLLQPLDLSNFKKMQRSSMTASEISRSTDSVDASLVSDVTASLTPSTFSEPKEKNQFHRNILAAQKGTEIHRFIESTKFSDDKLDSRARSISSLLKNAGIDFDYLLRHGYFEWGFSFLKEDNLIEGQIDLWAIIHREHNSEQALIIDWKTGSLQSLEKAKAQLKVYREALLACKRITPEHICKLYAVFINENKIISCN